MMSQGSFFRACDRNNDRYIDPKEFTDCYQDISISHATDSHQLMKLFDINQDHRISLEEYLEKIKSFESTMAADIEYTSHDGQKKKISMDEFNQRVNYMNDLGLKNENGKLVQEKSGSLAVDNIDQANPQVAQFINLAKWCQESLTSVGYARGKLINVQSLPNHESKHGAAGDFEVSSLRLLSLMRADC
jgi:hypothetical protein